LHDAVRDGDKTRVEQALKDNGDLTVPDEAGEPPLLIAALAGRTEIVAQLLDAGAAVGIRNKGGLTALHAAAYGGHLTTVQLLVAKGAAVNDRENFYRMTPLHAAAEEGRTEVVAFLLASGAEIEAEERNGYTPLTQAGWRAHWETTDLLLKAGARCQKAELVGDWLHGECTKRQ
ncbi:ankyrin repeat domain-containing protein, partial [Rhizobium alarense]|uniref:ankyrin repeat domain-containing protein n=1 Tax=Rhizobium alarense TaxID=2846851 RepID=UPI002E2F5535